MITWIQRNLIINTKNGVRLKSRALSPRSAFYKKYKRRFNAILDKTSFLPIESPISVRIWHVLNDMYTIPLCPVCGKELNFCSFTKGYYKHCSRACSVRDSITKEKTKKTWLAKYGVDNPSKVKEINDKKRKTLFSNNNFVDITFKIKRTKKERYGDPNYCNIEQIKETKSSKYGDPNYCNITQVRATKAERYGDPNYCNIEQARNTLLERYGVDHNWKAGHLRDIQQRTMFERYGQVIPLKIDNIKEKMVASKRRNSFRKFKDLYSDLEIISSEDLYVRDGIIVFECKKCSNKFTRTLIKNHNVLDKKHRCPRCFPHNVSVEEYNIYKYIQSFDEESVSRTWKLIPGKEIDVYSPRFKFAIEYNGLMYNSFGISSTSRFNNSDFEDRNKHLVKTELCEELGVQLLQIFDYEWGDKVKGNIWRSVINNYLGLNKVIYARKCFIKHISNDEVRDFIYLNHLQGYVYSKVNLGLFYEDSLVAVMTFSEPRFDYRSEWELIRFCNKINTVVVGGASRLLNYFIHIYKPKSIVSYANRRWSNGRLYEILGFKFSHSTYPSYFYFKGDNILSRYQCQKHKLSSFLEKFDESKTETENMYLNGYRKVYDCGNKVYKLLGC